MLPRIECHAGIFGASRAAALIWIMGNRRALGFRSQLDHRGRIMTYVLIVVSWLGGAVNGAQYQLRNSRV